MAIQVFHIAADPLEAQEAAAGILAEWKRRLAVEAEDSRHAQLGRRIFVARPSLGAPEAPCFTGYTDTEIRGTERNLGIRFPTLFRAYLREMGYQSGDLLQGSDLAGLYDFDDFRAEAEGLMAQYAPGLCLPQDAVVFMHHQGHTFFFLRSAASFDVPVFCYLEGGTDFQEAAPSFQALVERDLDTAP